MAWIESHQELREHPKTKRLCRLLSLPRPMVVGYLHFLWWWAYDYAADGDLSAFTDEDIADALDWEGDPGALVSALIQSGFVTEDRRLHDWEDFAQKWIERRQADRERKRARRQPAEVRETSAGRPVEIRETSAGRPVEIHSLSGVTGPDHTGPNRTGQQQPPTSVVVVDAPQAGAPTTTKAEESSSKRSRKQPTTPPPESLEPNGADYAAGAEVGLSRDQVNSKASAMLDFFRARGEARADWHATLRTWLRNAPKFDQPPRASPPSRASPAVPVAAVSTLPARNVRTY